MRSKVRRVVAVIVVVVHPAWHLVTEVGHAGKDVADVAVCVEMVLRHWVGWTD